MEPPCPIQTLGVNPFPSRFINDSLRRFRALIKERATENREMTVVLCYVKEQAANAFMRFQRIIKENGSLYESSYLGER